MSQKYHWILLLVVVCHPLLVSVEPVVAGRLYTYGGGGPRSYDSDTFELLLEEIGRGDGGLNRTELARDETGRLFGRVDGRLLEYDPGSLSILNERSFPALMSGLAVHDGHIFAYTDVGELLRFSAATLELQSGDLSTGTTGQDLAFDENGRLFGRVGSTLLEYDPATSAVLNQTTVQGASNGLAARAGRLYTYTSGNDLLVFDVDTFDLLAGTPTSGAILVSLDLAFDETGRLFGLIGGDLLEHDPLTREILNRQRVAYTTFGRVKGLAVTSIPEPTALIVLSIGGLAVLCRRAA